jgi:hypothetical protein
LTISSFCSSQMELDESKPIPREVHLCPDHASYGLQLDH